MNRATKLLSQVVAAVCLFVGFGSESFAWERVTLECVQPMADAGRSICQYKREGWSTDCTNGPIDRCAAKGLKLRDPKTLQYADHFAWGIDDRELWVNGTIEITFRRVTRVGDRSNDITIVCPAWGTGDDGVAQSNCPSLVKGNGGTCAAPEAP